jgi:predicted Fe-Mo cluster-binding NifX family protein
MRVLLDASIDAETLRQARQLIEQQPAVVEVKSLIGRNAGRYRFLEAEVGLRVQALEKAHQVSHAIETALHTHVPHVERIVVHVEPIQKLVHCVAVPLADPTGTVNIHFGAAPYFALTEMRTDTGAISQQMTVVNPHAADPRGRGLKVARWLLEQGIDVLITADDIREKGPGYALGDAGVVIVISDVVSLDAALASRVSQQVSSKPALTSAEEHNDEAPRVDSRKESEP